MANATKARNPIDTLRKAAYAADDRYSAELVRVYGEQAGTARYRWTHADAGVQSAMHAKLAADKAYWAAQCADGFATKGPADR
jgi:hypothetical protein